MSKYTEQAAEFLKRNGIRFGAVLSNSKNAPWQPSGDHFRVTLRKDDRRISFDFFGSVADMEARKKEVDPYDVLSCLSSDVHCPDTFKDFCCEFGYSDNLESRNTFRRCASFAKKLRAFFTTEEIDQLSEMIG